MHFYIREWQRAQAVAKRVTRVSEARGIHHNAVKTFVDGSIEPPNSFTLDVSIENFNVIAACLGVLKQQCIQFSRGGCSVDRGFAPSEVAHISPLDDQDLEPCRQALTVHPTALTGVGSSDTPDQAVCRAIQVTAPAIAFVVPHVPILPNRY